MNKAMRARRFPTGVQEGANWQPGVLDASDFVVATVLALAGGVVFSIASHGASLRVTFVPGMAIVFVLVVWLWRSQQPLPAAGEMLPWYLVALAVQLVHFAEEFVTGFAEEFPQRYGAEPPEGDEQKVPELATTAIPQNPKERIAWLGAIKKVIEDRDRIVHEAQDSQRAVPHPLGGNTAALDVLHVHVGHYCGGRHARLARASHHLTNRCPP